MYVLYIVGKLSSLPALSSYSTALIKSPSILADGVTAYLLYRFAAKYVSFEMSLFVAAFYLLNPAVLVNSTFWGQVDSFFTMIVAAAVLLLANGRIGLSSVLFTAAVLMKPQGIIYLPVLFFELVRRRSFKSFVQAGIAALVTAAVVIAPSHWGRARSGLCSCTPRRWVNILTRPSMPSTSSVCWGPTTKRIRPHCFSSATIRGG
ncbi:glycosyltransferase 87 family protein [Paenibacillus sp. P26]|nr:glycosyltransferase 87 family protein [Paenibacillus sp. P26]